MNAPRWIIWLVSRTAPPDRAEDLTGDLEEAHRERLTRRSWTVATAITCLEGLDTARASLWSRIRDRTSLISLLDLKLALRMLVRYPGLTVVAGISMAFAIWASASVFEFFQQAVRPRLPLDEGDRIVQVGAWNAMTNRQEGRLTREFLSWRDDLTSIEDLSAYTASARNLVVRDGVLTVSVASVSPSAFAVARVAPLYGRFLVTEDEAQDGPPVLVLGFEPWQRLLGGDPEVVGRTVRLDGDEVTVVGVMPEGFAFPVNHQAWTPLRLDPGPVGARSGPSLAVFGRLAAGRTMEEARAELAGLASRPPTDAPAEDERLRTEVLRYGTTAFGVNLDAPIVAGITGFTLLPVMLLLLIAATVSLLMFARAASRERELTVRTALGASRRRIVAQLFLEALALGAVATAVGLSATGVGIRWLQGMVQAEVFDGTPLPFWMDGRVSPTTVMYAAALTVLGAVVSGAMPALKLTRGVGDRLREGSAGGGGPRLGGVWSVIIVLQVAFSAVFPMVAFITFNEGMDLRRYPIAIDDDRFLGVQVVMARETRPDEPADTSAATFPQRYRAAFDELRERLARDPGVLGVTFAERLPRTYHSNRAVEVDVGQVEAEDSRGHVVGRANVDVDYFESLGTEVVAGRDFTLADVESQAAVVLVDQNFVNRVLGGANPIGRRVRYRTPAGRLQPPGGDPWYEIVGIAPDLGVRCGFGYGGVYHVTRPGDSSPLHLIVHTRGDPAAFAARARSVAAAVDPRLRLVDPLPLSDATRYSEDAFYDFWITLAFIVSGLALLISLTAIYSVMSFTVTRRTREIGVRVALGGSAARVVAAVLKRPLIQIGSGLLVGLWLAVVTRDVTFGAPDPREGALGGESALESMLVLVAYGLLVTAVCVSACLVPTRRALSVEPTQALGVDG